LDSQAQILKKKYFIQSNFYDYCQSAQVLILRAHKTTFSAKACHEEMQLVAFQNNASLQVQICNKAKPSCFTYLFISVF